MMWTNPPYTDAEIDDQANGLEGACQNQATQKVLGEQATATKKTKKKDGTTTLSRLKSWAESIVGKDDPRLNKLGFGGPAEAKPLEAPGQPQALESFDEKANGEVGLRWKKPAKGGATATYKIFRADENGAPVLIDAVPGNTFEKQLTGQPVGALLRYYIVAQNNAGEGRPGNTIEVRL